MSIVVLTAERPEAVTGMRAFPRVSFSLLHNLSAMIRGGSDNGVSGAWSTLRPMVTSPLGKKTAWYFSSQLLNAVLGVAVYGILTRALSVDAFGTYNFIIAFFLFFATFFDFGLASSGMRLLAVAAGEEEQRRRAGALLVLSAVVGVGFVIVAAAASSIVDALFHSGAGRLILLIAPLAVVYPLQEMMISIGQGSSRIRFLSVFVVLPRVLLLGMLLPLYYYGTLTLPLALVASLLSMLLAVAIASGYLHPLFRHVREEMPAIMLELREFGRQVYAGRIVDGMTTGLDRILLSLFHGMTPVGYYAVALTMTSPVVMFSRAVSGSAYKSFADSPRLPRALLLANFVWCTLGTLVLVFACELLIPMFFTTRYEPSLTVLPWLAVGVGLAGLNQPFHAFLMAQRQGRSVKIMSVSTSILMVVLNVALIPSFRMTGAAIAMIGAYGVNIGMNLWYYGRFRNAAGSREGFHEAV